MGSVAAQNITKPLDPFRADSLPDASHEDVAKGLDAVVSRSADNADVTHHIHAPMSSFISSHWVRQLIPGIERLAVDHHCGNFVVMRGDDNPFFETMPLYARLGMHLLFYGKEQIKLLGYQKVDDLLFQQSVRQGEIFDDPKSVQSIPSFIQTYGIQLDELLEPDISKYQNFNQFFSKKLKPDARPIQNAHDDRILISAADSRLTVFKSVDTAKAFWVKGQNFNIPNLLSLPEESSILERFKSSSVSIFRLAPADYHRFHSPIDCEVGYMENVPGCFYTVNPQAINEPGFDILTANTRSILYLKHIPAGRMVTYVAVGALLVGSITWTGGKQKGTILKRGDELGYFAYGGSTIVVIFEDGFAEFDDDLITNSEKPIETLVKVGYSIGKLRP